MALFGKKPEPPRAKPAASHDKPTATLGESAASAVDPATQDEPELELLETSHEPPPYGIQETIKLMRSLPVDQNAELVVRVIKTTLESLRVKVEDIVEDANRFESVIVSRMGALSREIEVLQRELDEKRHEVGRLEGELAEAKLAKERLLMTGEVQFITRSASVPAPPLGLPHIPPPLPSSLRTPTPPPSRNASNPESAAPRPSGLPKVPPLRSPTPPAGMPAADRPAPSRPPAPSGEPASSRPKLVDSKGAVEGRHSEKEAAAATDKGGAELGDAPHANGPESPPNPAN